MSWEKTSETKPTKSITTKRNINCNIYHIIYKNEKNSEIFWLLPKNTAITKPNKIQTKILQKHDLTRNKINNGIIPFFIQRLIFTFARIF